MLKIPNVNNLQEFNSGLAPDAIRPLLHRASFIRQNPTPENPLERWVFSAPSGNPEENIEFEFNPTLTLVPRADLLELKDALIEAITSRAKTPTPPTNGHAAMNKIPEITDPADHKVTAGIKEGSTDLAAPASTIVAAPETAAETVPEADAAPATSPPAAEPTVELPADPTPTATHGAVETPLPPITKTEQIMNLPVKETLGYKISYRRVERDMTESQLAEAVKQIASERADVDTAMIRAWETNQDIPSEKMFEALVQVLVLANDKVTDKEAAQAELAEAYKLAKEAHEQGQPLPAIFANKLWKYRDQLDVSERVIAEAVKSNLKSDVAESPDHIDKFMMHDIEMGLLRPSLGMTRAIVRALDNVKPLEVEEKADIFDSFSPKKEPEIALAPNGAPSSPQPTAAPKQRTRREASPEIVSLRNSLRHWLEDNMPQITGKQIAEKAEIVYDDYRTIFGNTTSPMHLRSDRLKTSTEAITRVIEGQNIDASKLDEFRRLIGQFITQATVEKLRAGAAR